MEIRELTEVDVAIYRPLRLRALREEPGAFGMSYEDAQGRPLMEMAERLNLARQAGDFTLGAFNAERLAGVVTFVRAPGRKIRHIGSIYAMYVAPEARRAGYERAGSDKQLVVGIN